MAADVKQKFQRLLLTQVLASFRYMLGKLFCTWSLQMTWKENRKATLKGVIQVGRKVGDRYDRLPQARDIPAKALIHCVEMRRVWEPFTQPFMFGKCFHR